MVDGHPIGPRGDYNYNMPVFGLRAINVSTTGSNLYGVARSAASSTWRPSRRRPRNDVQPSYGTFSKLRQRSRAPARSEAANLVMRSPTARRSRRTVQSRRLYQASASFDQPRPIRQRAARGLPRHTSFVNKSGLMKLVYDLSSNTHLTAAYLGSNEWDDKTGNGDNDYLPTRSSWLQARRAWRARSRRGRTHAMH